jgi:hypothetical protein
VRGELELRHLPGEGARPPGGDAQPLGPLRQAACHRGFDDAHTDLEQRRHDEALRTSERRQALLRSGAATIIVPDDNPSLAAAVQAAGPGDTIQVRPVVMASPPSW